MVDDGRESSVERQRRWTCERENQSIIQSDMLEFEVTCSATTHLLGPFKGHGPAILDSHWLAQADFAMIVTEPTHILAALLAIHHPSSQVAWADWLARDSRVAGTGGASYPSTRARSSSLPRQAFFFPRLDFGVPRFASSQLCAS